MIDKHKLTSGSLMPENLTDFETGHYDSDTPDANSE
jgi:hypothetical protein